jgi:hypothetical protein
VKPPKRPHGAIRQSQIVTTFGPGATVDLPRQAVIIGGLEFWSGPRQQIFEDRLVAKLEGLLGVANLKLYAPPIEPDDPQAPLTGITGFKFPQWFVAQYEDRSGRYPARPLVHLRALEKDRYLGPDKKRYPVVPVRFVQGCANGHISDIRWHMFLHPPGDTCRRQLWLEERGTSGDFSDVYVRCDCGQSRTMLQASRPGADTLGYCEGERPWLGPVAGEKCGGPEGTTQLNRLLFRTASDAYFPQVLRVISIPDQGRKLRDAVASVWDDHLQYVDSVQALKRERQRAKVFAAVEGYTDEAVWAEIQRRKGGSDGPVKKIKQAEVETLLSSADEIGEDAPDGADFYARRLSLADSAGPMAVVDRVVLLHRVREVLAQVGFTRFEAAVPDIEGELELGVRRAELAREITWLPAVENRGEGVFISFKKPLITDWLKRPAVAVRGSQLLEGFEVWKKRHASGESRFPGLPYVLLHSLSHLLITAVALECGYAASSIRERIYVGETGYGVLLSTGSPDADGTLGGLVAVGRRIGDHLQAALDLGRLCSNDPVCAQHHPNNPQVERFLHGSACHGCLLIAEPSCERRNDYLDRALVVSTVEGVGAEFFADPKA